MASSEVLGEVNAAHADDATWVLTSSFVILTMQSGFAMLEMGSSGKGHEVNILVKNVYDVVCGALAYYLLGYGISYGSPSNAFTGLGDYLMDVSATDPISSGLVFSNFIFQFSFAATSTTIVSGCLAMRCRFILYCLYSFYAVLVYSFVAHWVWSANGWLAQLGVHDFAGSGPVHLVGAVNGLIGILVLGPRHGRFDGTRPPEDFRPSSSSSLLIGLFMLWWGWIGFNCGSSFGITQFKWIVATRAGVTTINATAGGGIAALLYTKAKSRGRFIIADEIANGILGSLVAITATCACVHPPEAPLIGAVGGILALLTNDWTLDRVLILHLKIDDPVGAIGVHGASAVWGILAVGLFADGNLPGIEVASGLSRGGGLELLGIQLLLPCGPTGTPLPGPRRVPNCPVPGMPGLLHVILLLQFCRTGAAAATSGEVDSNDWAKDIVSAKSGELNREERIRAERAAYHARRSAAAASAAARAAEEVLSLSQRSAQRPKVRHNSEQFAEVNADHADDATWVLTSSFVILTMQSGFAMLEMGSSSKGHEVNIMLKNVYDVVFGGLAYYLLGFGISSGVPSNSFMGLGDFFLDVPNADEISSGLRFSSFLFKFSFAATSTTIVSGCLAMRCKFTVYCLYAFYAVLIYSFVAHWVWAADGWLAQLGVHDFAGGGPVHLLGAANGLVAILLVGPRHGRFDGIRPPEDFRVSSPTSILIGLFMLWWGWIGFNCGSTFGITKFKWIVATRSGVATINATFGGGFGALFYTKAKSKGRLVLADHVVNGILGSLVAITATCACVHPPAALIIGLVGAIVALLVNDWIPGENVIDDPVGAIGVHGAAAVWGILAVGLFADGQLAGIQVASGLFRGGGFRLLEVQLLLIASIFGWSLLAVTFGCTKLPRRLAPSLATIALSSEDSATRRAVAAATAAAEAERRAEGFAAKALAPEAGSATTTAPAKQAPAPSREEELMYQRERMAAQTAGLCVLSICIVLAWFQSNAVEGDYHRRKKDEADIDVFHRCGILCCCCRRMACCAWCCYKLLGLLASCSCSTLSVLGTVVFLMGYGFKELWDQHLIQPHLEEATIYLFFATIAFVILLIMVGAFVNWLRDKVGFVHNVMSFVDERMDDVMDFFGIHAGYDDDDDDLKDFKLPDVHDYDPKQVSNKRASPGKGAMPAANRGRDRLRKAHPWWLGPLLGANRSRRAGRENVREMPV
eukprot:s1102_g2.t2